MLYSLISDWLTEWVMDWLVYRWTDWLIDCFVYWLIRAALVNIIPCSAYSCISSLSLQAFTRSVWLKLCCSLSSAQVPERGLNRDPQHLQSSTKGLAKELEHMQPQMWHNASVNPFYLYNQQWYLNMAAWSMQTKYHSSTEPWTSTSRLEGARALRITLWNLMSGQEGLKVQCHLAWNNPSLALECKEKKKNVWKDNNTVNAVLSPGPAV